MNQRDTGTTTPPADPSTAPPPEVVIDEKVAADRRMLVEAKQRGRGATLGAFVKLSGPGWLQSAITLGGGSLAGALFLGIFAGFSLMWLQPLAMLMGIVMLSAIGYVALSTHQRPFDAINQHVNPVLGWGWAIATMMANLVWCMPQFSLGTAAMQQNLAPGLFGTGTAGTVVCVLILFVVSTAIVWSYTAGGRGLRIFELLIKLMVGLIVLSFFGVVVVMSVRGALDWGAIFAGFVPDLTLLTQPAPSIREAVAATGEHSDFWSQYIVREQRDRMVTAAATAVGINMTFLLPYSMLARGWDKEFRGLAIFDLAMGLFIPFLLVTSCVVIAAGAQFHNQPAAGLLGEVDAQGQVVEADPDILGRYEGLLDRRLNEELGAATVGAMSDEQREAARAALPEADRRMAASVVERDAFNLARSLEPLTGSVVAHYIFGLGVVGVAISTIIILMLINGFVVCEMLGLPHRGMAHRLGALLAGLVGATGPFLFAGEARFWLAVPTSVFGMMLLPIAYIAFFVLMNQRKLLGEHMPRGGRRVRWNVLMGVAVALAAFGAGWAIWSRDQALFTLPIGAEGFVVQIRWAAITLVAILVALGAGIHFARKGRAAAAGEAS